MHQQYHIAKAWRFVARTLMAAARLTPRRLRVVVALALTFAIGSAGQPSQAQAAAGDPIPIKFELTIYPEKLPKICSQGKLNLNAGVSKTVYKEIGGKKYELPGEAPAPVVSGSVKSGTGELKKQLQDIDGPPRQSIPFVFTAGKPGKVNLKFTAYIKNSWIGAKEEAIGSGVKVEKEVTVTVIPCKFKVTTIGEWRVPAANFYVAATSDAAEVKAADAQGPYTGSASVNWAASAARVGSFIITPTIGSSRVDWTGEMDDTDHLTINGFYHPAMSSDLLYSTFYGTTQDAESRFRPYEVQVSVLASGGVFKQSQVLEWDVLGNPGGYVTFIVVPEEDEAVAFILGNHDASWDDFSWPFIALLASQ